MAASRWLSAFMLVLALASGAAWLLQRQATDQLRDEIGLLRDDNRKLTALRADNARLAATLPTPGALQAMRADHAAVFQLREEIEKLKAETEQQASELMRPVPPPIPSSEWKNAGRATPAATAETMLWAISRQDSDMLAAMLSIDAQLRPQIDRLFAALPEEIRSRYGTVERLLVDPMIKSPPFDSLQILGERQIDVDQVELHLRIHIQGREFQEAPLMLKQNADGWRPVILPKAVQKLADKLGAEIAASRKGG